MPGRRTVGVLTDGGSWWVDLGPDPVPRRGDRAVVRVGALGTSVVVIRTRRGVLAFENHCPHLGRTLIEARIFRRSVECSRRRRRFRLDAPDDGSGGRGIRTWPAMIAGGQLLLAVPVTNQPLSASAE
jgi:nitrite reductase/ring-hydroxylating ferredoxin subunit